MITTYKFRLKDSSAAWLHKNANAVNFVWNYCNQTSYHFFKINQHREDNKLIGKRFLSGYDLNKYTAGTSKELGLHSKTIQAVGLQYADKRKQFKKVKLKWRSHKTSLPWIPFTNSCVKVNDDTITYFGNSVRFWKSQPILGNIKCGSFNADARGRWYVNLICEVNDLPKTPNASVGIDLGLKNIATLSNGKSYISHKYTKKYAVKLAAFQRANKKRQVRNVHAKIKNSRLDQNHKITTEVTKSFNEIIAGDLSVKKLIKTKLAKSTLDNALGQFKTLLKYKAIRRSGVYKEVSEHLTTQNCSNCDTISGPKGRKDLGVRVWICCNCFCQHDRDVNAAINILRIGQYTLNLK